MLKEIHSLLLIAVSSIEEYGALSSKAAPTFQVNHTRQKGHGDIASNVALVLAKHVGMSPRSLAEQIVQRLPPSRLIERTEIAGPGFINFFLASEAWVCLIKDIRCAADSYGSSNIGAGERVLVEFVSSNPTGPLHVGHGRGAAYGDALIRVLRAAGYKPESEYYINDAGRQMDILALSVWLRYLELCGESVHFPEGAYRGDYIFDIAATLYREDGEMHYQTAPDLTNSLLTEMNGSIDLLIDRMKECLKQSGFSRIQNLGSTILVADIQEDLAHFGIEFDTWFSEKSLIESGILDKLVEKLRETGHLYKRAGAWWFRSSEFGDEKDRVVVRENGNHTYFATDIAYHIGKLDRGFDRLINVWGADHHGYIDRMKAAIAALDRDPDRLTVLFVQFAVLYRGSERVAMSTRSGDFVTLRELRQEVGVDAARFFYVLRKPEQHMDFDLDLAMSQSNENPVYYVQYAHARICSVFRQLQDKGIDVDLRDANSNLLIEDQEVDLLRSLLRYPEVVAQAARNYEPHQVAYFIRELANDFHAYYNAHPFIATEEQLRLARLALIDATRQVLSNALKLLGVTAPQSM
jgi:arginyl-tRNA synthetase